jgi:hypothetical protein
MTEITQVLLILIIFAGHVKLYIDTGYQIPPELEKYYEEMPVGFAAFYDNGKFVKYLDLRQ